MQNKVVIAGAGGRMGQALVDALSSDAYSMLFGALGRSGSDCIGQLIGKTDPVAIVADAEQALRGADYLIDFTQPDATMQHVELCCASGVGLVIGTTGFSVEQKAVIAKAAHIIPIVMSPNMSLGVNLVFKLLDVAAQAMSHGYDIEIIEAHHRHKVDSPSGTALKMGDIIAKALGRDLDRCAIYGREGAVGPRDAATIGFSTIRGGDIVGDHTAMFCGLGERIEISHKSSSRMSYATGALAAVRYLQSKPKNCVGLFDMMDVLSAVLPVH